MLWWNPLLRGFLPDFMDTVTQLYPMRVAAAGQIRSGVLPVWLPNIFSGTPLLANPQISVLYPPQFLFYIAPGPLTNGLVCLFHYILGGFGAFFFVRYFGRGATLPALFAALTFQFSAMLVSRIALTPHLYTTVWVPWMLLAVEVAVRERGFLPRRGGVAVACLLALQILAGAPQITYYTAGALALYWLGRGIAESRSSLPRRIGEVLVQGALTAALAFLIAAVQLLPTLEFLGESERSAIALDRLREQGLGGGFTWRALVGFTGATIEDTDSINAIGPGAILLALAALLRPRARRVAIPLWIVSVLAYLLSLGALAGVWARLLPMYESFHAPRRALVLWSICGPLLAGLGAYNLAVVWRARKASRPLFAVLLLVLTAGTWWMLPRLERVFCTPERFAPDPAVADVIGESRFLVIDPTFRYSYDSRRDDYGRSLMADLACWHGTYDVNGYDPLVVRRYAMARDLACLRSGKFYPSHGVFLTDPASPVLALLNARYLVGRFDLFEPGFVIPGTSIDQEAIAASVELVVDDERWPLFRYLDERPLAWTVRRVAPAPSPERALQAAIVNDPFEVAFIEEDLEFSAPPAPPLGATRPDARRFHLEFDEPLERETLAVVSTTWMPGWSARSDTGERLVTLPVDGFLTGVLVPAGARDVTLSYLPASLLRGGALSLAGLLLAGVLWGRRQRKPLEVVEPATPHSSR
ncbi:MAG: hypothetical protein PWP23_2581 [Candidatus Sumerlaeota bacterium]|nr:hypothetical protein [Candidatus Sumerlaeota bacterium]